MREGQLWQFLTSEAAPSAPAALDRFRPRLQLTYFGSIFSSIRCKNHPNPHQCVTMWLPERLRRRACHPVRERKTNPSGVHMLRLKRLRREAGHPGRRNGPDAISRRRAVRPP